MRLLCCGVAFALALLVAGAEARAHSNATADIAAENAALSAQTADASRALEGVRLQIEELRKRKGDLDETMQRIERGAEVHVLGREFAQTVMDQLRLLPSREQFDPTREARAHLLASASDANLRAERQLRELRDLDTAVAQRLASVRPPIPDAERSQAGAVVRDLLGEQRNLLTRAIQAQQELLKALRDAGAAEEELEKRSQAARTELTRLLFWIPSPPGTQTVAELLPSLAWSVSPANWRSAGDALMDEVSRRPLPPALGVLIAVCLYAARGRLRRALVSLAPAAVTYERYGIGHALAALAITFALALPIPVLLWTAGAALGAAPDTQPFAQAVGDALWRVARLVLALYAFAWLFDRRGVAVGHFGWDETSITFASAALRRFSAVFLPLMLITALNDHRAPFANRESLGRLVFNLAMLVLVVFLAHLFRSKSPVMQRLRARAPRGWAVQLHGVWFTLLLALPLGIAILAATGYIVAAGYFFARLLESVFLVLVAVMLYGLIALWVQVQRARLVRRGNANAAPSAGIVVHGDTGSAVASMPSPRLDVAAIGEQTRSLLDLFTTLLLLAGMWWVWHEAVPALSVIGDYALWSYSDTVDDKIVQHPVTVGGLFVALIVGAVTAVAVRNVGALLDIVLLQRLEMQADATYAIKVTARYALAAIGIAVAANNLGIGWSDVQWLVAALGVGLGFGLQEIFANFVSGLIVLAERPIRIGDVVTVGDVSGTVSHIRARATSVIDFDNKEVIIPNKSFITDRVVNWTLSNQTTRLLLKISVAQGSDVVLAQRVMLDALRRNRDVLAQPPPSVFFVGFGSKGLDLEICAFVGSFEQRLRVQHEINLAVNQALRENGIEIP
ncbi:MAG TPA: mechanosensitive ion channel [Burkholderiales bacterium]|nr:mechanosensitive ion channel [Burkholderiales bacterium]